MDDFCGNCGAKMDLSISPECPNCGWNPSTSGMETHKSYKKRAGFWTGLLIIGLLVLGGILFLSSNPVAKIIPQEAMKISQEYSTPANSPVVEVTRLNSTTVKLVYMGGKYKNLLNSIEWFYCMRYTKPHGENIGECNFVYMGDSKSTTPLAIGSTAHIENTESKVNILGTGHFLYGSNVEIYDKDNV